MRLAGILGRFMNMIDPGFEQQWRTARALENSGQHHAAKPIYERLIAQDPARLYVRLRLVDIEQMAGNYRGAHAHAVRCADDVRNARWNDLAPVTRCLLTFDEWALVGELIKGADWSHPDVIRNSPTLSQHLWLIGEVADALRLVDIALPRAPTNASLHYSRANILRYLGRMDEATREYETCLGLVPDDAYVHWSLANHRKAVPAGSRIGRIENARRAHAGDGVEQPYLHYALYKEYEDAGDFGSAWAHLMAGAAIKRRQIRYDPDLEEAGMQALQEATKSPPRQGREPAKRDAHVPIFIVGMPRSGTTLLERILGGHSEATAAGELNDFHGALCWESNQFCGHFVTPAMVERIRDVDFAAIGRRYLDYTGAWTKGRRYLIDKNPENFVNAGYIAQALPEARIICLRRNPMDACMSNLKNLFSNDAYGYSYDLEELARYFVRFDTLSAHWRDVLGHQYMEMEYEQLAAAPLAMAEKAMAFCGLAFEPESVDITRNASPVTTASSAQVREPINVRAIGAWRKYERQLQPLRAHLEAALGPLQ
ncbi:MAG TPA: sulfotransferase [Thermomonas sp.]|nr:sulfotransferase [Thermomonas sp.]